MTVVATDGITIAADGQTTFGAVNHRSLPKIKVHERAVFAACGTAGMLDVLIAWYVAGADPEKVPTGDFGLLVCDGSTVTYIDNEAPYATPVELPWAMGSGGEIAFGAMLHGATPEEAVRLTGRRHQHVGGDILVFNIKEALGLKEPSLRIARG